MNDFGCRAIANRKTSIMLTKSYDRYTNGDMSANITAICEKKRRKSKHDAQSPPMSPVGGTPAATPGQTPGPA